ncbi:YggS family pyridoxal phosphate-dependent enzyme [bacterium]|nr:YggS family pyridoxal phosphate-dependent enzyme [bacterium]
MIDLKTLSEINEKIKSSTQLIAVSKTHPVEMIESAYQLGLRDFGENRVPEFLEKQESLTGLNIRWHFIGKLQRNKVKKIIGKAILIHSVDSFTLYEKIVTECKNMGIQQDCLLQINISNELQKTGFSMQEIQQEMESLVELGKNHAPIRGLMCIGSNIGKVKHSIIESEFEKMNELYLDFKEKYSFQFLSMGMSSDYVLAQEYGSNMVRIGSLLFGGRTACIQK